MAESKIIWTGVAKKKLYNILEFHIRKNKSKTHSIDLFKNILNGIKLLRKYPELGIQSSEATIKGIINENFLVLYEISGKVIIIHSISGRDRKH